MPISSLTRKGDSRTSCIVQLILLDQALRASRVVEEVADVSVTEKYMSLDKKEDDGFKIVRENENVRCSIVPRLTA